jgi:hypothetical protein
MRSYFKVFEEGKYYPISELLSELEIKYLTENFIIEVQGDTFKSNFVGEFLTPEKNFFSVPKNFNTDNETIDIFIKILDHYRNLKKEGKTLLLNNTFTISNNGKLESEKFYYNELKEFFLDFVTYEFIYPRKTVKKHTTSPTKGKIDVLSTIRNRKEKGTGVTYQVKDVENSDNWNIDDIYWSVVKQLSETYGSSSDIKEINDMKDFLKEEGYKIKETDISDFDEVIKNIEKCDVGIIHNPIKNTLLDYFQTKKISEKYKLKAFYTNNFKYVWEHMVRIVLYHNKEFEKELSFKFKNVETHSKWVNSNNIKKFLSDKKGSFISSDNPNIVEWFEHSLEPDLFSEIKIDNKTLRFIGDAKYYKDINSDFRKEMSEYNDAMENKYPMCIFVPSNITKVNRRRRSQDQTKELLIFKIDIKDVIEESIKIDEGINSFSLIRSVCSLINKYTNRRNIHNGF